MTTRTIDELRELAAGFVMDTLTLEERTDFERALRDPALAASLELEVAAHRETMALLGASVPVAPPAALRARMQQRIADEHRATPRVDAAAQPRAEPGARPAARPSRIGRAVPIGFALAFAASAIFALRLDREVRALRASVSVQERDLARTRERLAQREATLRTLTDAGNALVLVRLAPNAALGPSLQLFWNQKSGTAVIHASGLRALPESRTYQLWMIRDGKPVSVALFRPDSSGAQLLSDIAVPTSAAGIAAFAVTEEPAAGSPQPTMTPFLVGAVEPK